MEHGFIVIIEPSAIHGALEAPASKSSMQRAMAAALLARGRSHILRPGRSNDDLAAMDVIQQLGARIDDRGHELWIYSEGVHSPSAPINCGESGLGVRLFTPIAALCDRPITITGSGSLLRRPLDIFDEVFPRLGVRIHSNQGKLPLQIQGPLRPASIELDGSLSSQFLTGLLFAFAAAGAEGAVIKVNDLKSKPYIDLTLQVMRHFGWEVSHDQYQSFYFGTHIPLHGEHAYTVEGDWSGAAFLLVAGATAGPVKLSGLNLDSVQADRAIVQALIQCGAQVEIGEDHISVSPVPLKAFEFDATECPDLFPPLVALAAACQGKSRIHGTSRLTHKESDRATTLQEEFAKLGIPVALKGDTMEITGNLVRRATVHSRYDHRIAMACAVAALRADGPVQIEEAQAANKSYPDFYRHLEALHAKIRINRSVSA